ncbi:YbaN family protein [Streptococcus caviae]|uniref:YbaN family protein n=1 Tax=Streptococcus sp. 'caviae' TaxID=1915004 RepID=UPI00094B81F8|nr:YbaN family protein [Streptococcus sp. 'caviae']OLN84233.1 hypothetical protein BMI76_03285 [Streptococcus sp. 'caviae']
MKSLFYLMAGWLSFLTGLVGMALPIIPTTPLLLLAGFCFARSSKRFEKWLRSSRIYQFYVADYAESKSISASRKKKIILQIYLLMGISIYFAPLIWVKVALFGLTIFITYYLFRVIPDKEE